MPEKHIICFMVCEHCWYEKAIMWPLSVFEFVKLTKKDNICKCWKKMWRIKALDSDKK